MCGELYAPVRTPSRLEQRLAEPHGGRLAVGADHVDRVELCLRVAQPIRAGRACARARTACQTARATRCRTQEQRPLRIAHAGRCARALAQPCLELPTSAAQCSAFCRSASTSSAGAPVGEPARSRAWPAPARARPGLHQPPLQLGAVVHQDPRHVGRSRHGTRRIRASKPRSVMSRRHRDRHVAAPASRRTSVTNAISARPRPARARRRGGPPPARGMATASAARARRAGSARSPRSRTASPGAPAPPIRSSTHSRLADAAARAPRPRRGAA